MRRHRSTIRSQTAVALACVALACLGHAPGCASTRPPSRPEPSAPPQATRTAPEPPATEQHPVVDHYHGVAVTDPYRWLEDSHSDAVRAWTAAQNAYTRSVLDALPDRPAIGARVAEVLKAPRTSYRDLRVAGGRWFVLVDQPPKQQPFLTVQSGSDPHDAKPLLDPNALDPSGKTTIDWFVPTLDGMRVAVSLSQAGTESGDVHVVDVENGAVLERVPRVNGGTAGGHLAWTADGKGFYYTRYPRSGERPSADLDFYQQLYFHQLGSDSATDRYELGRDFPRIAEIRVYVDARSGRVLCAMQNGDGGEFAHYLRASDGRWRQLTRFEDKLVQVKFGPGDDLFAISRKSSPRGVIVQIDGNTLDLARARVLHAPVSDALVSDFWDDRTLLFLPQRWYAIFQLGGPTVVRAFDYGGAPQRLAEPLPVASVRGLVRDGERSGVVRAESFLEPAAWYLFDEQGAIRKSLLANTSPIDLHGNTVVRELAVSKDGTQVPVTILLPPGAERDGSRACIATGYGGYGLSLEPRYRLEAGLWLEQGVIYAVANLRGGGEFGEDWHRQGSLLHKQNVFDDFAAVLRHLVARGYCRSERLGILGGSNGGLLMGATLVQHPELVRAVVSWVGIYDMLRSELSPNGEFNVTEFGTVKDRAQFDALYAYSPYHHVKDRAPYPAVLLLTGENDPRVEPMQSRKMAARLQAASTRPVLLRTSADTGHGGGSGLDQIVAETTDAYAFMLEALGVKVTTTR